MAAVIRYACLSFYNVTLSNTQSINALTKARKGTDAILKLLIPLLDASSYCVQSTGDTVTAQQLGNSIRVLQITRDTLCLFSLPSIFQGVVLQIHRLFNLFLGLLREETVALKTEPNGLLMTPGGGIEIEREYNYAQYSDEDGQYYKYNEVAITPQEKIASAAISFFKFLAGLLNIFNFGISKPIVYVRTYIGVPLSEVVKSIGNAFGTTIFVYHVVEAAGHLFDLIYQRLAFDRACANNSLNLADVVDIFYSKVTDLCVNLTEKAFELLQDVLYFSGQIVPAPARITLNLILASFTLYQVWHTL